MSSSRRSTEPCRLPDAEHAAGANDAIAESNTELVWFGENAPTAAELERFGTSPRLALLVTPSLPPGRGTRRSDTVAALTRLLDPYPAESGSAPTFILRTEALINVGGFDPRFPGLGLPDLCQRLMVAGWSLAGLNGTPTLIEALYEGLDVEERFASEALWYKRHGRNEAGHDLTWFRRATLTAAGLVTASPQSSTSRSQLARRVGEDARTRWAAPPPHETQTGVGFRADWRFLLPDGPRSRLHVALSPGLNAETERPRWQWLVDDGWIDSLTVGASHDGPASADVVLVTGGADLKAALGAASPDGSIIVEQPRSARPSSGVESIVEDGGFRVISRHLATPSLDQAKRLIPLDSGSGLTWMVDNVGPAWIGDGVRQFAGKAIGGVLRSPAGAPAGDRLVVATRRSGAFTYLDGAVQGTSDLLLLTSGHDEGSRAIVLPLGAESNQPDRVLKVSSRPSYNHNIVAEASRIAALREMLQQNDPGAARLLPDQLGRLTVAGLEATAEVFAGRWTAAAVCYQHPERRAELLERICEDLTRFTKATTSTTEPWTPESFERFIAEPFARYQRLLGEKATLNALYAPLQDLSRELEGLPLALAERHYDLGPWNVMLDGTTGSQGLTFVDWELAPPRTASVVAPAGADHLYFAKYWLHIALETASIDDELDAFLFLAPRSLDSRRRPEDPRSVALSVVRREFDRLGIDHRFVPLLTFYLWLETALYTIERRGLSTNDQDAGSVEPGSAKPYLETLARHRQRFLAAWRN